LRRRLGFLLESEETLIHPGGDCLHVCWIAVLFVVWLADHARLRPSGLFTLIKDRLAGGASRLAALLLPHILPVCSVVAPCHPGAALRDLCNASHFQGTSDPRIDRLTPVIATTSAASVFVQTVRTRFAGDRR